MKKEDLINEVREGYANIANNKDQQHFHQTTSGITPEAYYNTLCEAVIREIENGNFHTCHSGMEIINKVAADKSLLHGWNE